MSEKTTAEAVPLPWRGRLIVFAGIVLVGLDLRIAVTAISPIAPLISADIPLTSQSEGLLGMVPTLAFAAAGIISPALVRRFGLEALMVLALVVSLIGEVARSLVDSPLAFLAWTIPTMLGPGIGNIIAPPLVKRYFPDRLGVVTAVYTACVTISTGLPALFVLPLAEAYGWRFAVGSWAILAVLACLPWLAVLFSPQRQGRRLAAVRRRLSWRQAAARPEKLAIQLGRSLTAWAIMVLFGINSLTGYTFITWLPALLRDAGLSDDRAAGYLGLLSLASLPGAFLVPVITARIKRVWLLPVIFCLGNVVGFLGFALAPAWGTWLWIACTRIGDCFYPFGIALITLRTTHSRGAVALSGFVQSAGYLLACLGPWGVGALHDLAGSWQVAFLAIIALFPFQLLSGLYAARAKPLAI